MTPGPVRLVAAPPHAATRALHLLRHLGLRLVDEEIEPGHRPTGRYDLVTVGNDEHAARHPVDQVAGPVLVVLDDPLTALARTARDHAELERALCRAPGRAGGAARLRDVAELLLAWVDVPGALVLRPADLADEALPATLATLAGWCGADLPDRAPGPLPKPPEAVAPDRALSVAASLAAGDLQGRLGVGPSWWPPGTTAQEAVALGALPSTPAGIQRVRVRGRGGALDPEEAIIVRRLSLATATVPGTGRVASAPSVALVHVRKAAGTTLDHLLRALVDGEVLADDLMRLPPALWAPGATDGIGYAKAHSTAGALRALLPDAHLLAMLRDPVDRLVSHHGHLQWERTPPEIRATLDRLPDLRHAIELASSLGLEAWIRRQATHGDAYLPDHQTWALAGPEDAFQRHGLAPRPAAAEAAAMAARARQVLEHELVWFGIVDEHERSMRLLEATFDLPEGIAGSQILNAAPARPPALDPEVVALVEQEHRHDLELLAFARTLLDERCAAADIPPPTPAAPADAR